MAVSFRDVAIDDLQYGPGVVVSGGYGKTGDRKHLNVSGEQTGVVSTHPGKGYQLTYLMTRRVRIDSTTSAGTLPRRSGA